MNSKWFGMAILLTVITLMSEPVKSMDMSERKKMNSTSLKGVFPRGEIAASHFTGKAWVSMMADSSDYDISTYNVTFEPGARNDWHSHSEGQILLCTSGIGFYQERGRQARRLMPGDVVQIPSGALHWHGAAPDGEFSHIGITPKKGQNATTWGTPVTDEEYSAATGRNIDA